MTPNIDNQVNKHTARAITDKSSKKTYGVTHSFTHWDRSASRELTPMNMYNFSRPLAHNSL